MANLDISGKVLMLGQVQSGEGKNGTPWTRQELIIETEEQYPKKICLSCWGDKSAEARSFAPGEKIKASISIESREYNGRWYTDIRAWKFDKASAASPGMPAPQAPAPTPYPSPDDFASPDSEGDLPF
jgi:hypothetical protein